MLIKGFTENFVVVQRFKLGFVNAAMMTRLVALFSGSLIG